MCGGASGGGVRVRAAIEGLTPTHRHVVSPVKHEWLQNALLVLRRGFVQWLCSAPALNFAELDVLKCTSRQKEEMKRQAMHLRSRSQRLVDGGSGLVFTQGPNRLTRSQVEREYGEWCQRRQVQETVPAMLSEAVQNPFIVFQALKSSICAEAFDSGAKQACQNMGRLVWPMAPEAWASALCLLAEDVQAAGMRPLGSSSQLQGNQGHSEAASDQTGTPNSAASQAQRKRKRNVPTVTQWSQHLKHFCQVGTFQKVCQAIEIATHSLRASLTAVRRPNKEQKSQKLVLSAFASPMMPHTVNGDSDDSDTGANSDTSAAASVTRAAPAAHTPALQVQRARVWLGYGYSLPSCLLMWPLLRINAFSFVYLLLTVLLFILS